MVQSRRRYEAWAACAAWFCAVLCGCSGNSAGPGAARVDVLLAPDAATPDVAGPDVVGPDLAGSDAADADAPAPVDAAADQADGADATDAAPAADAWDASDAMDAADAADAATASDAGDAPDTADMAVGTDAPDAAAPADAVDAGADVALFCDPTPDCDDGNACTADTCAEGLGCQHAAVAANTACDDGDPCSTGDVCVSGACKGAPVVCAPDANPCTDAKCDAVSGCIQVASTGPCNDKNPCTKVDLCVGTVCTGTQPIDCNDNDTCTDDLCVAGTGCTHPLAAACNDLDSCTADSCTQAAGCAHKVLYVGASCDDGNVCTVWDACSIGVAMKLVCVGGPAPSCDDGNVCTNDSCVAPAGCVHVPSGGACDDFDPCTGPDLCAGDYCIGGSAKLCADDGNPCTVDFCISMAPAGLAVAATADALGCVHQASAGACEDGNPCTADDACAGTVCVAGAANGCDDKNACTLDACVANAACSHTPEGIAKACDDGSACTLGEVCNVTTGACAGAALDCSDSDPCTADVCDPKLGCTHPPLCDDGDPCTQDVCSAGACTHQPLYVFKEDFSGGNAKGWTLDEEWQVGAAQPGPVGNLPPGDPGVDHSPGSDNMVAGVVLGGVAKREAHAFRYLTSPPIDTTGLTYPALEFWRWLQADMEPYMVNHVDVFDGAKWHTLWHAQKEELVNDKAWTRFAYDVSKYKSVNFRFRIGFSVPAGDTVLAVGSWTIDDVTVGASWTCIENPLP